MRNTTKKKQHYILMFVLRIAILAAIGYLVLHFVMPVKRMSGNTMFPSVRDGDLCIFFTFSKPHLNDVVLYEVDGEKRIGRVIASGGQTVEVTETGYTINGYQPYEEFPYETTKNGNAVQYPLTLDTGEYFVMNDYRSQMDDSRTYGTIPKERIRGVMIFDLRRRGF